LSKCRAKKPVFDLLKTVADYASKKEFSTDRMFLVQNNRHQVKSRTKTMTAKTPTKTWRSGGREKG
jgi:hypothetical protein